ncbi:MAG: hypothetical protein QXU79_04590, partial [Candidatus Micrarchaeaceae archaeon]
KKKVKQDLLITRFKKVIRSWLKFNVTNIILDVNIANENVNLTKMDEGVPLRKNYKNYSETYWQ